MIDDCDTLKLFTRMSNNEEYFLVKKKCLGILLCINIRKHKFDLVFFISV